MTKLQEDGVAAGVVQNAADLAGDPQLRERGFFVDRPEIAKLVDASPIKLSETPAEYRRPAPTPGRDNAYVYGKLLGMSETEMAELSEKGII
jgi:formyl-CoA transferase